MDTMERLSGDQIKRLMRAHGITIRAAAAIFDITQKRVRIVRAQGVAGSVYVWEWGTYLPTQHHTRAAEALRRKLTPNV